MPELPEVEVLARHLAPLLKNKTIHRIAIRRRRVLRPTSEREFKLTLKEARFADLNRRGKYLVFSLRRPGGRKTISLLGHLGMTGRMYLQPADTPLAKHAAVVLYLGKTNFIFEDTRYFGRLTLDTSMLTALGPEPLGDGFSVDYFLRALKRSAQPIKVKLLDQSIVAGVGNIYASEALFRAGLSPRLAARGLTGKQVERLWHYVREVLAEAIQFGSTIPLDLAGTGRRDGLFYYGQPDGASDSYDERLQVYDRQGLLCERCGTPIKRIVQAARGTFYCPRCQKT
jgi:formamidopyrimidine-DNA glycosylase